MKVNFFHNSLLIFLISNCYFSENINNNNQFQFESIKRHNRFFIKPEHKTYSLINYNEYKVFKQTAASVFAMKKYFNYISYFKKISSIDNYFLLLSNICFHFLIVLIMYYFDLFDVKEIKIKQSKTMITDYIELISKKGMLTFLNLLISVIIFLIHKYYIKKSYKKKSIYYQLSLDDNETLINFLGYYILSIIIIFILNIINQLLYKKNINFNKINILIIYYLINVIIFLICQYIFFKPNIYYMYNDISKEIVLSNNQIKIYNKLIPYLIKSNKTIFDLADDDPEALKLLNS